jgi:DNA-directed RNA polymerase sigma subunit (sigma70/sigma32)
MLEAWLSSSKRGASMQEMMPDLPNDMPLDAFALYRHWVNWTPELPAEEEQALFLRLAQGPDGQAETRLIAGYQKLVQHIVRGFCVSAARLNYDSLWA